MPPGVPASHRRSLTSQVQRGIKPTPRKCRGVARCTIYWKKLPEKKFIFSRSIHHFSHSILHSGFWLIYITITVDLVYVISESQLTLLICSQVTAQSLERVFGIFRGGLRGVLSLNHGVSWAHAHTESCSTLDFRVVQHRSDVIRRKNFSVPNEVELFQISKLSQHLTMLRNDL